MSFDDFVKNFTNMDICHMINTSIFSFRKTWKEGSCVSAWKKPHLSGGCANHEKTFLNNPQVRLGDIKSIYASFWNSSFTHYHIQTFASAMAFSRSK